MESPVGTSSRTRNPEAVSKNMRIEAPFGVDSTAILTLFPLIIDEPSDVSLAFSSLYRSQRLLRYPAAEANCMLAFPVRVLSPSRELRVHPDRPLYPVSVS